MKKNILLATALAITTLAGCTDDGFVGDQSLKEANGNGAISFNSGTPAVTRGDKTGKAAAEDLNGKFYVWGIKNENTDELSAAATGNLVYNNYVVEWADNSAMTSTSNTEGWEYVGKNLIDKEIACITPNGETSGAVTQTIKYWDFGASDYTFYAFSADPNDLNATVDDAKVKVVKDVSVTSPKTVYDKGYTVTLAADANLDKLFFSERVNITESANTERRLDNTYGGNVTFRFHNGSTKVRVAMYETIPGYSVTIDKFLVDNDGTNPTFAAMEDEVTDNFAANLQNSKKGDAGTLTVTYNSEAGATQNWPILSFVPASGNKNYVLALGDGLKANEVLGTSITGATYDKEDNPSTTGIDESYTSVFPNETNSQNLKLKVNYTLTAIDNSGNATTGETIKIEGATAEIPAAYLKWKPGFAYTYIFKISDNTNGSSGQGVVGLYPITFDAVEVIAEDGAAEYITTVSEPSITTFGVKSGKYTTGKDEYEEGSDIYVTIMDGSSVATPTLGNNVNVYLATTADANNFKITEASVAEALAANESNAMNVDIYSRSGDAVPYTYTKVTDASTLDATQTYYKADESAVVPGGIGYVETEAVADVDYVIVKIKATTINSATTPYFTTTAPSAVTTVPGEDGIDITDTHALKLTGVAATTATTAYVIEYIKSEVFTAQGYTYADAAAFAAAGKLYTTDACTTEATTWADASTTYYKKIVNMPGTKVYKVIKVAAAE